MKTTRFFTEAFAGVWLLLVTGLLSGCTEKDLFDQGKSNNQILPAEQYFGFETRTNLNLSVNYDAPGYKTVRSMMKIPCRVPM